MLVDREVTVRLLQGRPVFLNANEKNIGLLFLKERLWYLNSFGFSYVFGVMQDSL
jgi:hypothetical protein